MPHRVINSILHALGGGDDVSYQKGDDGKLHAIVIKNTPGMSAKKIIAGALTGLVGGAGVEPGPGHLGRALVAGFDKNAKRLTANDQQQRQTAEQDFNDSQEVLKNKATMAHLAALTTQSAWESKRLGVEINSKLAEGFTAMQSLVASDPGNRALGTFKDFNEFLNSSPELQGQIAKMMPHGMIQPLVHPDGSVTAYAINQAWAEQKLDRDMPLPVLESFDKAGKPIYKNHTIKAGTVTNGDYQKYLMGTFTEQQRVAVDAFKQQQENLRSEKTQAGETARTKMTIEAENQRAKEANASRERVATGRVAQKEIDTHSKTYVKPAMDTEQSYQQMDRVYQEYLQAKVQGKDLPTGAGSMLALSQHLATTFGVVKGARVTKDMIHEHLGARSVTDSMRVAVQQLINGDQLSPDQWHAFHSLISSARELKWEGATREAVRSGVPINFVPQDLHGMAETVSAPKGAAPGGVWSPDGRELWGHVVDGKFVPLPGAHIPKPEDQE